MKLYFKKYFFILLLAVLSLGTLVSFGYADFYFGDTNTSTEISDVPTRADPIRQNAVFGEQGDTGTQGTKYYDVYFLAQSVYGTSPKGENNGEGQIQNYYYQTIIDDPDTGNFGAFYDDSGNLLTDDITQDRNRYFIRVENVAEISLDQLEEIGQPSTKYVFDQASSNYAPGNEENKWEISFLCFSPLATPVYQWNGQNVPEPQDFHLDSSTTVHGYRVNGYYPHGDTFESFYANSSLSIYDDYSVTINGRDSLVFYPVYTVGKNYINLDDGVDEMSFYRRTVDEQGNPVLVNGNLQDEHLGYATYEGNLTKIVRDANPNSNGEYTVYSLMNQVFEEGEYENYTYYLSSDLFDNENPYDSNNQFVYPRFTPTYGNTANGATNVYYGDMSASGSNLSDGGNNTQVGGAFYSNMLNLAIDSGRYNIYIIVKSNNNNSAIGNGNYTNLRDTYGITRTEIENINRELQRSEYNIGINDVRLSDYMCAHSNLQSGTTWLPPWNEYEDYFSRQYYVVYERLYEPKLVAGTTGTIDYEQSNSTFTRVGTGQYKDQYVLRDVYLDAETETTYQYNGQTSIVPNNHFGIQLLPEDGMEYDLITNDDSWIAEGGVQPADWPLITVGFDDEDTAETEPYRSDTLLEDKPNQKLLETRSSGGSGDSGGYSDSGTYNLYIKVNYSGFGLNNDIYSTEHTISVPNSIEVYAYQFNDLFINIYNNENDIQYQDGSEESEYYLKADAGYAVRIWNLSKGIRLSSNMVYNDITGGIGGTLGQYIQQLDNNGQYLMEYVSGRHITLENYQDFVVDKNYIFIVCDKPSA